MIPNPLRDPRDRRLPRVPEPCALVVFGITGDLARKKLLPAVYDLANRGLLPTNFALLGFARRDWGDTEFAELARESALKAYADHGSPGTPVQKTYEDAAAVMKAVADAGVDLDDVFRVIEDEGVQKFVDSWDELTESVRTQRQDKA